MITSYADEFYSANKPHLKLTKNRSSISFHNTPVRGWKSFGIDTQTLPFNPTPQAFSTFIDNIKEKLKDDAVTDLPPDLKDIKIICDVLTGQKYISESGGLMPYDFETWKATVDDDTFYQLWATRELCVVAFNPHKPRSWEDQLATTIGKKEWVHYNSYIPPDYKLTPYQGTEYPLCEDFVRPFLEIFLPNDDERHYVLYWLYKLMHERRNDVLVLIGIQGNGKNTFMSLASILAGKHNFIIGSKAFGKEKFNSEIMRRKLVSLDEYSIKGSAKESLKCFSNDFITVEAKGQDPIHMENHCSFIIANNSMKSTDLEFKDRRFTCPLLSDKDLILEWGKEKIHKFKDVILTTRFQLEFPAWLTNEVKTLGLSFPNQMNYITPYFYRLVEAAKPEWFKEFKRLLRYKASVNSQDIFKSTKTRVSDTRIAEELLKENEEREQRDLRPHVIAQATTIEGRTQYISNIFEGDNHDDEDAYPTLP